MKDKLQDLCLIQVAICTWNQPIELDLAKSGEHHWSFMFVIMKGPLSDEITLVQVAGLEGCMKKATQSSFCRAQKQYFKKYLSKACIQQQDDWEGSANGNLVY